MFKFFNIFFLLLCISCSDLERVNEYDDFHIDNAPDAPINFSITQNNSNITLTWNNNTETDLAGYNIYIGYKEYSFSTLKYTLLNSSILVTNTYSYTISEDADVYNDTYYYYIKAIDYDENQSDVSNTISVVYPIPTPPDSPTGITIGLYYSYIKVTWSPNTESDINGYNIYRSTSANGTYGKINSYLITSSLVEYDNAGLIQGTTYYYKLTAVDNAGNESEMSDYSSFFYLTTDITPPAKPTGVTTVEYAYGSKTTWYANTESDIDGYNVYRSTSANGTYGKINSSLITYYLYDYDNAGLIDGTTYYYRVTAVDDAGNESEMSDYSSFLYID